MNRTPTRRLAQRSAAAVLAATLSLGMLGASAQTQGGTGTAMPSTAPASAMHGRHGGDPATRLGLTGEKAQQLNQLMQTQREQAQAEMTQMHERHRAELARLLTPEQLAKLDRMGPGGRMGGMGGGKGGHGGRGMGHGDMKHDGECPGRQG